MKSNLFDNIDFIVNNDKIEIVDDFTVEDKGESSTITASDKEDGKKPAGKQVKGTVEEPEDNGLIDLSKHEHYEIEEEEEYQEVEDTQKKETPPNSKKSASSSPFKPFAKALYEEGFLASYDDEEFEKLADEVGGEAEALFELTKRTIQSEIEEYKNNAEEDFRNFLEAREAGVDLNKWGDIYKAKNEYNKITEDVLEEDVKLQKKIVTDYLKEKGFTDDEIRDTIETYEDTDRLFVRSRSALNNLKQLQARKEEDLKKEAQQRELEKEDSIKKTINTLKTTIYESYDKVLPGIKLTKKMQDAIFNSIVKPVKQLENGEKINAITAKRLEDPIRYAIIEAYLVNSGVFDGKIVKQDTSKTKALAELKKSLDASRNTAFKTSKSYTSSDADIDDNWRLPNL